MAKLTITREDMDAEWQEVGASKRQCRAFHRLKSGTIVFCVRPINHDGDHRGYKAQWSHKESGNG